MKEVWARNSKLWKVRNVALGLHNITCALSTREGLPYRFQAWTARGTQDIHACVPTDVVVAGSRERSTRHRTITDRLRTAIVTMVIAVPSDENEKDEPDEWAKGVELARGSWILRVCGVLQLFHLRSFQDQLTSSTLAST